MLERCKEIELSQDTKELLFKISSASIDRCLRPVQIKTSHGLNTLTCTDISTGWTNVTALQRRSQEAVSEALHRMRPKLPFPLLRIDSDNGSQFINDFLYRYCLNEKSTFTRSRPYKKNDQAHVEHTCPGRQCKGKNWSVVRHTVGYDRWETNQEFVILENIYDVLICWSREIPPIRFLCLPAWYISSRFSKFCLVPIVPALLLAAC